MRHCPNAFTFALLTQQGLFIGHISRFYQDIASTTKILIFYPGLPAFFSKSAIVEGRFFL